MLHRIPQLRPAAQVTHTGQRRRSPSIRSLRFYQCFGYNPHVLVKFILTVSISFASSATFALPFKAVYMAQADDIDAVANIDEIDEAAVDDYDNNGYDDASSIDSDVVSAKPAYTMSTDGFDSDLYTAAPPLDLTVDHVPLNAIAPDTIYNFVEIIDIIRQAYVKPVNDESLFQYAIAGMLEKLDKNAEYLTAEHYENLRRFTEGNIGQVGLSAYYDTSRQHWVIDTIVPRSSASTVNIKLGDALLGIKKVELTADMTRQDIEQLLSGIAGSQVNVLVANNNGVTRSVMLQRNLAKNDNIDVTVRDGIAIVRLPIFQNNTKEKLLAALRQIDEPITGVVVDVRNNPGGVLSAAIEVASLFLSDKALIQVRNRTNSSQIIRPNGTPYLIDLPVVVLQNRYSASASEVLASSLKSNQRAYILGETSYGKGTVQEVIPLKSGGAIKLTVAEYRSATGEPIDGVGIKPNIALYADNKDWHQQAVDLLLSEKRPAGIRFKNNLPDVSLTNDY